MTILLNNPINLNQNNTSIRIYELDFTKGILVILMVIYHTLNYSKYSFVAHEYISFLPPSFIMISGFIITRNYISKQNLNLGKISKRLFARSLKLLFIFTFLNIMISIFFSNNLNEFSIGLKSFLNRLYAIYFIGSPKIVAFDVLIPISYLLFIAIFISFLQLKLPFFIRTIALISFLLCVILEANKVSFYNLELVSVGLIGMLVGLIPLKLINQFCLKKRFLLASFVLYGSILFLMPDKYYRQVFLTIIALTLIYSIAIRVLLKSFYLKQIVLMGQHSLLGYIFQIFLLVLILKFAEKIYSFHLNIWFLMLLTLGTTWGIIYFVEYSMYKNKYIKVLYNTIFR